MKNLSDFINENSFIVKEAKSKYYEDTINELGVLLAVAPQCNYNLNSSDLTYAFKGFLEALKNDNYIMNVDSMEGIADPKEEIKKLKTKIVNEISSGLEDSCHEDYNFTFNHD